MALAYFRVIFGLTLFWEAGRYLTSSWIAKYYTDPGYHFHYWPFSFVKPWPEPFMTLHFIVLGWSALMLAAGLLYRLSAITVFVTFTWVFLLDQSRYLNHFYLTSLLAFVMIFLPADRALSLDAWRNPARASSTVPAWTLGFLQFQLAVPYFFGGVAKLAPDWFAGEPMRTWLSRDTDFPLIGPLFTLEPVVAGFVHGGLLGDLLVVPLLLFRRTRVLALGWMIAFHLLNSRLFVIGIFPWMMIMATYTFLPSDWLRRVWDDVRRGEVVPLVTMGAFALAGFVYGNLVPSQPSAVNAVVAAWGMAILGWEIVRYGWDADPARASLPKGVGSGPSRWWTAVVGAWVAIQLLMPFRHLAIPGDVHWTEEGHRWSWHMKLRDKELEELKITLHVPGEEPRRITRRHHDLGRHQWEKMGNTPDMLVQYAHHLKRESGHPDARVTVEAWVSLNGRPPRLLVDPERDLAAVPFPWVPPADFVLPLDEPLPRRRARRRE